MTFMSSNQIREAFLSFFEKHGHTRVDSSSLVPGNDPTLLFTNAGMVQFKDCFLGSDKRDYVRAVTSQKCVRAGGKHNDLENVGYTARHHTFFEMLGNFSFGDYFKEEAIRFAWDFLTNELKLPKEKLWVTVYHDDQEAEDIWFNKIGIDQTRFSRLGEKDNFLAMGDTGPCGPCSEIFYDHGPEVAGGPPGSPDEDGDRYIEVWNLVFMQFNRDKSGNLTPLPKPSVDTGMGLERISAVMQHVHSNYEIDLFESLIKAVAAELKVTDLTQKSLRVIADHIRSCVFLIGDGVVPSNEGRGYVLRRIMRRAIRHGHKLGASSAFFHKLVTPLAEVMGVAYPDLISKQKSIVDMVLREEEQFAKTLDNGMKILENDLAELQGSVISGQTLFTLYDTYGFPVDLTADIAREKGLTVDNEAFEQLMAQQRKRSQAAGQFSVDYNDFADLTVETYFDGYEHLNGSATIVRILQGENSVETLKAGEEGLLITESSVFYAESGGQAGDLGTFVTPSGKAIVTDTIKIQKAFAHVVKVTEGMLNLDETATLNVDASVRRHTAIHHSATHLLHAALREVLGEHVNQKGSLVNADRLRFDFSHPSPVSKQELRKVERLVNQEIMKNSTVTADVMSMDQAKAKGAMALFGEKYGDEVRVLSMGDFSTELCGGTHVTATGDIGVFKITQESGIAAGIRRIEAVAGEQALTFIEHSEDQIGELSKLLKSEPAQLIEKSKQSLQKLKELEKQLEQLQSKLSANLGDELADKAETFGDIKLVVQKVVGVEPKALRELLDQVKNKIQSGIVVLGLAQDDKVNLIAGVTNDLIKQYKAGDIVKLAAEKVGGKGGGRPDMAQAGGSQPENLDAALKAVKALF